jgi:hypothetical protein
VGSARHLLQSLASNGWKRKLIETKSKEKIDINNYPYNPSGNQGQQYSPYQQQQPWYGNNSVVGDRTTHQSLLSKVLMILSFSLVMARFGMFAVFWLLSSSGGQRAAVRKRRHQERRESKRDLTHPGDKIIHWVGWRAEPKRSNPRSTSKACWHLV